MGKRRGRRGGRRKGRSRRSKSIANKVRGLRGRRGGGSKNRARNAARRAQARARANARRGRNNSGRNNSSRRGGNSSRNNRGGNRNRGGGGGGGGNSNEAAKAEAKKQKRKERRQTIKDKIKARRDKRANAAAMKTGTTEGGPRANQLTKKPVATGTQATTGIESGITDFDPTKFGGKNFGMKDYDELKSRGYGDKQIVAYAVNSGVRLGGGFRNKFGVQQNEGGPKKPAMDGSWDENKWNYTLADGTIKTGKGWVDSDPDKWEGKLQTGQMQGQFVDGEYQYGKKFNKKDIRIMTEAGKSIDDIKGYMKDKGIKNERWFDTMFSRINKGQGFDESGENFDYGYRFDKKDIDKMFDAGKDQQYISDFISNNEALDDNKWANAWMDRYGMDPSETPEEETNPNQELLDRISGLEEQIKGMSNQNQADVGTPAKGATPAATGPVFSPWANALDSSNVFESDGSVLSNVWHYTWICCRYHTFRWYFLDADCDTSGSCATCSAY